jgi:hypothetical protein
MNTEQEPIQPEPDALDLLILAPILKALAAIDVKSPAPDNQRGA